MTQKKAHLYLLCLTLLWGSTFPILKWLSDDISPALILWIRLGLSALACQFFFHAEIKSLFFTFPEFWKMVRAASFMGLAMFLAFCFQLEGMRFTTASHSAFITGFYCMFAALLSFLLGREKPQPLVYLAIGISMTGLYFLSISEHSFSFRWGDFLTFICAICVAVHIYLTDKYSRCYAINALNALQLWWMWLWATVYLSVYQHFSPIVYNPHFSKFGVSIGLLYLGIFCTAFTFWIQTLAQKYTAPSFVGLIFIMETVFGALFSMAFLAEWITAREAFGAALILAGLILSQIPLILQKKSQRVL